MEKRAANANQKDAVLGIVLFCALAVIAAGVCYWVVARDNAASASSKARPPQGGSAQD